MLPDPNDVRCFRGYTVTRASHWVFYGARWADGTGPANGNEFPDPRATNTDRAIVGDETDAAVIAEGSDPPVVTGEDGTPKNFLVLARADLSDWPGSEPAPPSLSPDDQKHWLKGDWGCRCGDDGNLSVQRHRVHRGNDQLGGWFEPRRRMDSRRSVFPETCSPVCGSAGAGSDGCRCCSMMMPENVAEANAIESPELCQGLPGQDQRFHQKED